MMRGDLNFSVQVAVPIGHISTKYRFNPICRFLLTGDFVSAFFAFFSLLKTLYIRN